MENHRFLVELGTEELPPKALPLLMSAFADHLAAALQDLGISPAGVHPYATPRRLAVLIDGLPEATPSKEIAIWGPPAKISFDAEGKPTKAAVAFARKNGVDVVNLKVQNDGKADKLVHCTRAGGDALAQLLPGLVEDALGALPIGKRMRWGASRVEFVRPVHWLVMLFDEQVVPCSIMGLEAGRTTRGHRFHCDQPLTIERPQDYAQLLAEQGWVMADFAKRQQTVHEQVTQLGQDLGGLSVIADDLLSEVTALVEWPVAMAGNFEQRFLEVPAEALISSMKEHQKYFHVVDHSGKLLPHFITVANLQSEDPAQVIAGNEKVIRPRLSDAAFFFATDKKTPLIEQREKLRRVVFQAQLGSLFEKTERVASLAGTIAEQLGADQALARRAGELSKADLTSTMVYEFADMQGIAGYYYALHDGEPEEVAKAMNEQYLPRFAGDALPATQTGSILALADRLDTLAGIFGLGQVPTGSKDPFGLRRASLGALRLLVEKRFDLDLRELLSIAVAQYPALSKGDGSVDLALNYMLDRFRAWYEEANIPATVYQAVAAKQLTCPLDINNRIYAVAAFCDLPEAEALAAANKRVSNILSKQASLPNAAIREDLLQLSAERELAREVLSMQETVEPLLAQRQYREALATLAGLGPFVDRFFLEVMVMVDDASLRDNRLALLQRLRDVFLQVADISYLAVSK